MLEHGDSRPRRLTWSDKVVIKLGGDKVVIKLVMSQQNIIKLEE